MPLCYDAKAKCVAPKIGGRYRLRNGAEVRITARVCVHPAPAPPLIDLMIMVGRFVGTTSGYTCQLNGMYAPEGCGVHPHELDVVKCIKDAYKRKSSIHKKAARRSLRKARG